MLANTATGGATKKATCSVRARAMDLGASSAKMMTSEVTIRKAMAVEAIPAWRALTAPLTRLRERAEALAGLLKESFGEEGVGLWEGSSRVGGGALPTAELPTVLLSLQAPRRESAGLAERLRSGEPPVLARLQQESLLFDLRTVYPEQDALLLQAILDAAAEA